MFVIGWISKSVGDDLARTGACKLTWTGPTKTVPRTRVSLTGCNTEWTMRPLFVFVCLFVVCVVAVSSAQFIVIVL